MVASVVVEWVVPAILAVLVLAAIWIGIRWAASDEVRALRAAPLFSGLSTRQLRSILHTAAPIHFPPGETITTEGGPGDSFYLIKEGDASVLVGGVELGTIGPRGYFGEVSVIDGGSRTATVRTKERMAALELTSRSLRCTLGRHPSIARLMFLKLRRLLIEQGEPVPYAEDDPVDESVLAELGQRLRKLHGLDWSPGAVRADRGRAPETRSAG